MIMEKIFDVEVERYLLDTGVSQKEIDKIKFNKLKELTVEKLFTIINLINDNKFDKVSKECSFSPAGDGYGLDNHFINFGETVSQEDPYDIVEICELLKELK
jgi:hypothetical protein